MECAILADYQYLNHIHMTQKELYTSPEVAVLTLQSEGLICQSTGSTVIPDWGEDNSFPSIF